MPPGSRRGARSPGPADGQVPVTRYMGMAAAAIVSVVVGMNQYERNKNQFLENPSGMPKNIKDQILGTDDDEDDVDGYPAATSNVGGGDLSNEHLQSLLVAHKKELICCNNQNDYTRATYISQTLEMIKQVLDMRDDISREIEGGNMQIINSTYSKLDKTQRALEQRIQQVKVNAAGFDVESSAHSARSASDDDLSKEEVVFFRTLEDEKMKTIDSTTHEGAAKLRVCYKRIKLLDEALEVLEAIDNAENDEEEDGLRERFSLLQRELLNKDTTPFPKQPFRGQGILSSLLGGRKKSTTGDKKRRFRTTQSSDSILQTKKPARTSGRTRPSSLSTTSRQATKTSVVSEVERPCPEYGPGWTVTEIHRKSGLRKGRCDKYWRSSCGKQFRSEKEVERFRAAELPTSNKVSESNQVDIIKNILGRRWSGKRTEYLVHWKGYDKADDFTLEPAGHLGGPHVLEPEKRWGDTKPNSDGRIEVNDVQRDSQNVLLYAKLRNFETDVATLTAINTTATTVETKNDDNISTSDSDDEDSVSIGDVDDMEIHELKAALADRHLDSLGDLHDMRNRLRNYFQRHADEVAAADGRPPAVRVRAEPLQAKVADVAFATGALNNLESDVATPTATTVAINNSDNGADDAAKTQAVAAVGVILPEKRGLPTGVYKTPSGKFVSNIYWGGKPRHIGTFDTPEQASAANMFLRRDFEDANRADIGTNEVDDVVKAAKKKALETVNGFYESTEDEGTDEALADSQENDNVDHEADALNATASLESTSSPDTMCISHSDDEVQKDDASCSSKTTSDA